MAIVLGDNEYGKAETRVVRIVRGSPGDQSHVLPTDTQKNTVFAFAKERGVDEIEDFALALARHFVDDIEPVRGARVEMDEFAWDRIEVDGRPHEHSFVRRGQEVRTATVSIDTGGTRVVSGLRDLVVLKSTGSEFKGFLTDRYTTLGETDDRIMATSLVARWRHTGTSVDWAASHADVRALLLARFAEVHSRALQQTLWEMGRAVLSEHPQIAEITLSAPNRHHVAVDLTPFGLDNPGEVFFAADRPYGLIQATIARDD